MDALIWIALLLGAFLAMEGVAYVTHRWVMHGFLWCWHRSHHEPRDGVFERNDLFAVVFALPSIGAIWLGVNGGVPWMLPVGIGIALYGAFYAVFHDGLVHRRFPVPLRSRNAWLRRLMQAHRLHHAVSARTGCVSYGFLWAPPVRRLRARLRQLHPDLNA